MPRNAGKLARDRHAIGRADGSTRVRSPECVVLAFLAAREARHALPHTKVLHAGAPACEHFMAIRLMADVPDQAIVRRVENIMQGNREFYRAEIRRQVSAGLTN